MRLRIDRLRPGRKPKDRVRRKDPARTEEQAEWQAFVRTCRRRDVELLSRVWPGYAEELKAAQEHPGAA